MWLAPSGLQWFSLLCKDYHVILSSTLPGSAWLTFKRKSYASSLQRVRYLQTYIFYFVSIQLLFQILQLESCNTDTLDAQLEVVAKEFCNLSVTERTRRSYVAMITVLQYLDVYKFIYKVCLLFYASFTSSYVFEPGFSPFSDFYIIGRTPQELRNPM